MLGLILVMGKADTKNGACSVLDKVALRINGKLESWLKMLTSYCILFTHNLNVRVQKSESHVFTTLPYCYTPAGSIYYILKYTTYKYYYLDSQKCSSNFYQTFRLNVQSSSTGDDDY